MHSVILALIFAVAVFGQQAKPSAAFAGIANAKATTQPAQTITIEITSELATAIEQHRLLTGKGTRNPDGTVTITPTNATVQDHVVHVLMSPGGYFYQLILKFPPESVKKAREDSDAAAKAVKDVIDSTVGKTGKSK